MNPSPVKAVTGSNGILKLSVVHVAAATVRVGAGVPLVLPFTPTHSIVPVAPPLAPMAALVPVSRMPRPTLRALSE